MPYITSPLVNLPYFISLYHAIRYLTSIADGIAEDETRISSESDGTDSTASGSEDADAAEGGGPAEQPHLGIGFHARGSFLRSS